MNQSKILLDIAELEDRITLLEKQIKALYALLNNK